MLPYTYLIVNALTLSIPLCLSFDSRVQFYKSWRYLFPAIAVSAAIFIPWDSYFTAAGVWGFNPAYITGITLGNLPLEEILFFICIPYACVFLYEVVRVYNLSSGRRWPLIVSWSIVAVSLAAACVYADRVYTRVLAGALAVTLIVLIRKGKPAYWGPFYGMYVISKIPFLLVNGILTNGLGTASQGPIVWYNSTAIIGLRILGIPVEDFGYSMLLLLTNITVFEFLRRRHRARQAGSHG